MITEKNFTLIELLVVISVIAILAGLLLPALSQAREKARQIQCMNNERELTRIIQSYSDENNDYMLPTYAYFVGEYAQYWSDFFYQKKLYRFDAGSSPWPDYKKQFWHCPSAPNYTAADHLYVSGCFTDYGINAHTNGFFPAATDVGCWKRVNLLRYPSQRAFVIETVFYPMSGIYSDRSDQYLGYSMRHTKRVNMTFHDGHADAWQWGSIPIKSGWYPHRSICNQGDGSDEVPAPF